MGHIGRASDEMNILSCEDESYWQSLEDTCLLQRKKNNSTVRSYMGINVPSTKSPNVRSSMLSSICTSETERWSASLLHQTILMTWIIVLNYTLCYRYHAPACLPDQRALQNKLTYLFYERCYCGSVSFPPQIWPVCVMSWLWWWNVFFVYLFSIFSLNHHNKNAWFFQNH